MLERFTAEARQVVVRAQEEARALGHGSIGTEHLVLALAKVDSGIVVEVFAELGITSDAVRQQVRKRLGPGPDGGGDGQVPLTALAKRVLELSLRESLSCEQQNIRPEHLLLAVARVDQGGGSEILRALGADPDQIRTAVRRRVPAPVPGQPLELRSAGTPEVPPPVSVRPDGLLQHILLATGRLAQTDEYKRFGLDDLLRVCTRDEDASQRLSELGIDVDRLRERLRREPPAA